MLQRNQQPTTGAPEVAAYAMVGYSSESIIAVMDLTSTVPNRLGIMAPAHLG